MSEDTHDINQVHDFGAEPVIEAPVKIDSFGFTLSHCVVIGGSNGPMVHIGSGAPRSMIHDCSFIMSEIPKWYQLIRWGWLIRRLYTVRGMLRPFKRNNKQAAILINT